MERELSNMRRKTIYLHVGHGKTGSSYMQSCFANSIKELNSFGISYPIEDDVLERARKGYTTEGNFPPISLQEGHSTDLFKALIEKANKPNIKSVLVSNEGVFQSILLHRFLHRIVELFPDHTIKTLMFIRDPFEHIVSAYQELLKAAIVEDIADLIMKTSIPSNVKLFLRICDELNIECSVVNFSRNRANIREITSEWLGLKKDSLKAGPRLSVNRSLTRSEIQVQKEFNKVFGSYARRFVADPLTSELPTIKPSYPYIPSEVLKAYLGRMAVDCESVNKVIPSSERYHVPELEEVIKLIPTKKESEAINLTTAQLEVIVRNLAQYLSPK